MRIRFVSRPWPTLLLALLLGLLLAPAPVRADDDGGEPDDAADEAPADPKGRLGGGDLGALRFRSLGPALMAGRIGDIVVDPVKPSTWYVAACSGGVWKTTNAGVTWKPIFDGQGSYSIGCLAIDPTNRHRIWVGTGENNAQRSVSFGDGIYRSDDGGASWTHCGLKDSEHIGMIRVHPEDGDVVYVAAQGPLWRSGGERGVYKSVDGGTTWARVLHVSDDTGVNEVHLDPRDPDVMYASAWQRRRHVWTLIDGGPESSVYKSTDGGATWVKRAKGLPGVDLGRIGLAVAPTRPDTIYAIVEAAQGKSGFYRSTDRGASWQRRSGHKTSSPQYYNELVCDPTDPDRVFALDTVLHVTEDGGASFQAVPRKNRHVDDHALWIDPNDTDHMVVGCDGGVYETFDRAEHWHFKANLPITQFYRVSVDDSQPFYFVYGGTQDNNSQGGPSRTTDRAGITNADWFITVGGDGYETRVDPTDPNIVYSQWQYGGLVRHDRRSGERVDIKPREAPGEPPLRWNWDSPLILSAHQPTRLYFAANKLFRTDDRGNSWRAVSDDLTRQIDRDTLKVMGRIQGPDAVAKHDSTSFYGNIVSLDESPLDEDLLYVGTDDGLVQITEDGGTTWRTVERIDGVPERTYVSCLTASPTEKDTVYATFDNHKMGDFTPYVYVSRNRGRTWTSIGQGLPARHVALAILQDHAKSDLLFLGTEFGVFASIDRGGSWIRLKNGLPTIAVRDMAIQKRENDLVLGTFGRGFYVLDDYTPLRHMQPKAADNPTTLYPIKRAWRYLERSRLGGGDGRGSQGSAYYTAKNPTFGAVFTYRLAEGLRTPTEARRARETKARKAGEDLPYPSLDELRREADARTPEVLVLVRDDTGAVIQRIPGPRSKGLHRVAWNLRLESSAPVTSKDAGQKAPKPGSNAPLALPGTYTAQLVSLVDGVTTSLTEPQSFEVEPLELATFAARDKAAVLAFQRKAARLERAVLGADRVLVELSTQVATLRGAIYRAPAADLELIARLEVARRALEAFEVRMRGDPVLRRDDRPSPRGIKQQVQGVTRNLWRVTSPPTQTQRDEIDRATVLFTVFHSELEQWIEDAYLPIRTDAVDAGAPWSPTYLPIWPPR